jgi:hypothetical protein
MVKREEATGTASRPKLPSIILINALSIIVTTLTPAKVRIRLLLETGSQPQENRLVLPVFPFRRFRGSTLAYANHRSTHRAERRGVGVAAASR